MGPPDQYRFLLSKAQRVFANIIGITVGIAGLAALFLTENQAGTAVCLLLAGVLLLVGIQGTPLIRFGSGEHSFELDTARRTEEIADRAAEVAETDPNQAEALLEGFIAANPAALSEPRMQEVQRLVYEQQIHNALAEIAPNGAGDQRFSDYVIPMTHDRILYVEVHFAYDENPHRKERLRSLIRTIHTDLNKDRSGGGYLIVTNSRATALYGNEVVKKIGFKFDDDRTVIIIPWINSSDNDALRAAIRNFEVDDTRMMKPGLQNRR